MEPRTGSEFVDALQARGRYVFRRSEALDALRVSEVALAASLRRLEERQRIVTPRRGFHVVVPLEHSTAGAPPASWFVDALMAYLEQPYYVGLLSAAALHGAAHQQPMVFQVVTDRTTRSARVGRSHIEFHRSRSIETTPIRHVQTETGTMRVATVEATALDLVRFPDAAGGLGNVATVLRELAERIDGDELGRLARLHPTADVQRLGHLFELVEQSGPARALAASLAGRRVRPVRLSPGGSDAARASGSSANSPWRVIENVEVEPDT